MSKRCPTHGPIDWPHTALTCPVPSCGEELEAFDTDVELGLAMGDVLDNRRRLIADGARIDLEAAERRLREMRLTQRRSDEATHGRRSDEATERRSDGGKPCGR